MNIVKRELDKCLMQNVFLGAKIAREGLESKCEEKIKMEDIIVSN